MRFSAISVEMISGPKLLPPRTCQNETRSKVLECLRFSAISVEMICGENHFGVKKKIANIPEFLISFHSSMFWVAIIFLTNNFGVPTNHFGVGFFNRKHPRNFDLVSFQHVLGGTLRGYKLIPKIPEFLISFHSSMFWMAHFLATK